MKRWLILCAVLAVAAAGRAGLVSAGAAASRAAPKVKPDVPPRHLSEAERAELRRQLEQFNLRYRKHP